MSGIKCNYCGYRAVGFDCRGKEPPKCLLIDAELNFEGEYGVWRTPDGREAMKYRQAGR